jgi:hypoxanthine-DNA glycosylase
MFYHIGFPAVATPSARILILGSLPGAESLRQRRYYAHPRNAFWKIMDAVAGAGPEMPYEARLERLKQSGLALWDVCRAAERKGSLDTAIAKPEPNDFVAFFKTHRKIERLYFNGQAAATLFCRLVAPKLVALPPAQILPSTSPANARLQVEEKLEIWREALALPHFLTERRDNIERPMNVPTMTAEVQTSRAAANLGKIGSPPSRG